MAVQVLIVDISICYDAYSLCDMWLCFFDKLLWLLTLLTCSLLTHLLINHPFLFFWIYDTTTTTTHHHHHHHHDNSLSLPQQQPQRRCDQTQSSCRCLTKKHFDFNDGDGVECQRSGQGRIGGDIIVRRWQYIPSPTISPQWPPLSYNISPLLQYIPSVLK